MLIYSKMHNSLKSINLVFIPKIAPENPGKIDFQIKSGFTPETRDKITNILLLAQFCIAEAGNLDQNYEF